MATFIYWLFVLLASFVTVRACKHILQKAKAHHLWPTKDDHPFDWFPKLFRASLFPLVSFCVVSYMCLRFLSLSRLAEWLNRFWRGLTELHVVETTFSSNGTMNVVSRAPWSVIGLGVLASLAALVTLVTFIVGHRLRVRELRSADWQFEMDTLEKRYTDQMNRLVPSEKADTIPDRIAAMHSLLDLAQREVPGYDARRGDAFEERYPFVKRCIQRFEALLRHETSREVLDELEVLNRPLCAFLKEQRSHELLGDWINKVCAVNRELYQSARHLLKENYDGEQEDYCEKPYLGPDSTWHARIDGGRGKRALAQFDMEYDQEFLALGRPYVGYLDQWILRAKTEGWQVPLRYSSRSLDLQLDVIFKSMKIFYRAILTLDDSDLVLNIDGCAFVGLTMFNRRARMDFRNCDFYCLSLVLYRFAPGWGTDRPPSFRHCTVVGGEISGSDLISWDGGSIESTLARGVNLSRLALKNTILKKSTINGSMVLEGQNRLESVRMYVPTRLYEVVSQK
jgi:hypothetical protein